jgi:anaerobic selenocysteine-containing dehydrogenase
LLYRTLGPVLDRDYGRGAASGAILWGAAHKCVLSYPASCARAGFAGEGLAAGEALFEAIMTSPSGVTFTIDEYEDSWARLGTDDGRIHLVIDELLAMLPSLEEAPIEDAEYPFMLSAGERRSFTANTIIRDNTWRKRDPKGALRISPEDADRIGLIDGGMARVTTRRGSVQTTVEVSHMMRSGHVSLPNGMGVGTSDDVAGIAPNELTDSNHRDPIALTPFHKQVSARVEAI